MMFWTKYGYNYSHFRIFKVLKDISLALSCGCQVLYNRYYFPSGAANKKCYLSGSFYETHKENILLKIILFLLSFIQN